MRRSVAMCMLAFILSGVLSVSEAQTATADTAKGPWGRLLWLEIDPSFFRPAGRLFFDFGGDETGEVDLFKDGRLAFTLDMVGFDFFKTINSGKAKLGGETAFGIGAVTDTAGDAAGAFMVSGGGFLELARLFRLEAGIMMGLSAREGLDSHTRDDSALFVGVAFPTTLGEVIKDLVGRRNE